MSRRQRGLVYVASSTAAALASELRRVARRRSTWVLRFGAGTLIALVLFVILASTWLDDTDRGWVVTGELGRSLFFSGATVLGLLTAVLAPTLVAQGLEEERENGTLELLLLSRLPPVAVVASRLGTRLGAFLALAAGAIPFLALATTMGGVSPGEVTVTIGFLTALTLVLGTVGAWHAVHGSSGLAAGLGGFGFMVTVEVAVGWMELWRDQLGVHTSGWLAYPGLNLPGGSWSVLGLALVPVWGALVLGVLVSVRRGRPGCLLPIAGAVLGIGALVGAPLVGGLAPTRLQPHLWPVMSVTALYGFLWAYFSLVALALWLGQRRPSLTWRLVKQRRVWGHPVAWRETLTRTQPLVVRVGLWVSLGLFAFTSALQLASAATGRIDDEEVTAVVFLTTLTSMALMTYGLLATVATTLRGAARERDERSLASILTTTLSSWGLVLAKHAGPFLYGGVPLLLGVLMGYGALTSVYFMVPEYELAVVGATWGIAVSLSALLPALSAWTLLVDGMLLLGLRASPRLAWPVGLAASVFLSLTLTFWYLFEGARSFAQALMVIDGQPGVDAEWVAGFVPAEHLFLAMILAVPGFVLMAVLSNRVRVWGSA